MDALEKFDLIKTKLNPLNNDFSAVKIELQWDYGGDGNNVGIYKSVDHYIPFNEFNLEIDITVEEKGHTTPVTRLQPSEHNQISLSVVVSGIRMRDDNHDEVEITAYYCNTIKEKITNSIHIL